MEVSTKRSYVMVTYETDIWLDNNIANLAPNGTTTLIASTTQSGASVTWASSDTAVATVASTGTNTCRVTAVRSGVATVTATLSNGQTDSCTVYVSITDGVYFLKNSGMYLSVDGGMVSGSCLTLQTKKVSGPAQLRQLWKIKHLGQHSYSIRSMYRPDLALISDDKGIVQMAPLSTSIADSSIPNERRWKIVRDGNYYSFQFTETYSLTMQPKAGALSPGTNIIAALGGGSLCNWSLEWDATVEEDILLINTQNGLPATNAVRYVVGEKELTLADMNLMVSFISRLGNQTSYYWYSYNSEVATVAQSSGKVTIIGSGIAKLSVHTNNSAIGSLHYTLDVQIIEDGMYYIRNWGDDLYIEVGPTSTGDSVYGNTFAPNLSQLWIITNLEDGTYSIRSTEPEGFYLGIHNDSGGQGTAVVPRSGSLTDGMKWIFSRNSNGGIKIRAQSAQENLYITNVVHQAYSAIQQSNTDSVYSEWLFCQANTQIIPEIQEQDLLCWVTCARMASSKYMKSPINQSSASYYANYRGRKLVFNESELQNVNRGGGPIETCNALEYILGWEDGAFYGEGKIYSETTLRSLLDAGNVVIAGRQMKDKSSGHAYLVFDYEYNSSTKKYDFYIYDPWYEEPTPLKVRSYAWLCDGEDAYNSAHEDNRIWRWVVTYKIGDNYSDLIAAPSYE